MNGLDQVIVALWFLTVILFVVIPLSATCLWLVISLIISAFSPVAGQAKRERPVMAAATA